MQASIEGLHWCTARLTSLLLLGQWLPSRPFAQLIGSCIPHEDQTSLSFSVLVYTTYGEGLGKVISWIEENLCLEWVFLDILLSLCCDRKSPGATELELWGRNYAEVDSSILPLNPSAEKKSAGGMTQNITQRLCLTLPPLGMVLCHGVMITTFLSLSLLLLITHE